MYRSVLALLFASVLLLSGCAAERQRIPREKDTQGTDMAGQSSDMSGEEGMYMDTTENVIYLAGGCFWGMEQLMQSIPGVIDAQSGYANGTCEADATYQTVCKGDTGFRETVRVEFDPEQVSLDALLLAYFYVIDPTVQNRQGVVISAPEDWTLTEVTHRVVGKVHKARTEKNDGVNGAMDVLKKLPRPVLAFVIWIIKTLDFFGKVPDFLRQDDPNFATVFLTNLGSIKCPSVYHHLNNYGSSSIMAAIGTIRKSEKIAGDGSRDVRDVVDIGFTLDERIADGFYFARSLKIIQHLLTHPELLELPLNQEVACG